MSAFILKDISVELASREDCFLTGISHLILEVNFVTKGVTKVNLFSRESSPGVWDADQILLLHDASADLVISVSMEIEGNQHQQLGFMELNVSVFYDGVGTLYEIPLIGNENYPSLIFKTRPLGVNDVQKLLSGIGEASTSSGREDALLKVHKEASTAYQDYELHGRVESLDKAITLFQDACNMVTEDSPALPTILSNLGLCLHLRFKRCDDVTDIDDSISRHKRAVGLTEDSHPDKPSRLNNLGIALQARFKRYGTLSDIEDAIKSIQMAVTLSPDGDSDKPGRLSNLGSSFLIRFGQLGDIVDMNNAITSSQAAVNLIPDGHPTKPDCLDNLGISLQARFQQFGDVTDIDNAIAAKQAAVDLTPANHPDRPHRLNNLGGSLEGRFNRLGRIVDIDNAILSNQDAVNLMPDGHPDKPACLTNLGSSLQTRFNRLGDLVDISNAIASNEAAVDLTPNDHPRRPMYLNVLGNSLQTRFERLGDIADIDKAIASIQVAVNVTPDGHPNKPVYLNNLGNSLQTRFKRLGDIADIDKAISFSQAAVNFTPDSHPDKPMYLTSLGNFFQIKFEQLGTIADIDDAIMSTRASVTLTPDGHPNKPVYLNNLGNSFQIRFKHIGDLADLDDAIASLQAAVDLTPDGHPNKPACLNNLGSSFETRFRRTGDIADIDSAIRLHQVAVNLMPDGHSGKSSQLNSLASAISIRFLHFRRPHDAEAAISTLSASITFQTGRPMDRFRAAIAWGFMASLTSHASLLDAYEHAITMIPLVAWLGLPIPDRHQHLVKAGGVTRDAAAAAVSLEQYEKAIEWLEQGRSVVWNQILQLRTPVDALRDIEPDLAARLVQVSRLLDQGTGSIDLSGRGEQPEEEKGRQYRALAMERESIIDQVRSLPQFKNFLRPLGLSQLTNAAQEGPIIVLSIAEKRCDALALVPGLEDVIHIPLPNITSDSVTELVNELKDLLSSNGIRMRGERAAQRMDEEIDEESCKHILAELWNNLVKPILDSLAFSPNPDTLPRIWWCATGPLAFLPIHAAGIYDSQSTSEQLCNYAISSYIPSISTLLEPFRPRVDSAFKLLSVIQPSAPGASAIPNTKEELECIRRRISDRPLVVLEGEQGTKQRVMKAMGDCNWLHLACHGVQRPEEPTKSALILQDGHLTLEEIIRLNLPNAEFAFLSACQTTTGDEKLSEEAVHIAGGMLLAGYRGVVATMWSIQDDLAPAVADEFYAHLTREGQRPDSRKAAEALHVSIQKLRKKRDVPLTAWIPFVHLGV